MGIRRIRRYIREGRYKFTAHALEEMDEDNLREVDVCLAISKGRVVDKLLDDPRGIRFVVRGNLTEENIEIEIICRFLPSGLLRIITVYALEE